MSCKKIAQVLKNVPCSVHHLSLAQNSKFTQNSFQLDHKDQALDELEMRQSQLISGAVSGAAAADDAQPAPDASADAAKPGAADREPVVAMVTLSQEEREAFLASTGCLQSHFLLHYDEVDCNCSSTLQ